MNLPPNTQELIEQYLNGVLKGQALQDFEIQLANNKELATEVAFQKEMHLFLAETQENELRKNLQIIGDQITEIPEEEEKGFWWWLFPIGGNISFWDWLLIKQQKHLVWMLPLFGVMAWWLNSSETTINPNPSIAILPFLDIDPQKEFAYLGEGMAEEILLTLTELPTLKVAGRAASFSFSHQDLSIVSIGERLQVGHILKGSIERQNEKIQVTAQLINVADGAYVWSDNYEGTLTDVYDIQVELLQRVATFLLQKLGTEQQKKLRTPIPATGEVYDLFLQAKHFHKNIYKSSHDLNDFHKSEALFLKAIKLDPNYAPAHAGLADLYDSYWVQIQLQEGNSDKPKYQVLMEQESEIALQLAPDNAYVNQVKGYVLHHLNKPKAALKSFLKSYKISPRNPESLMGLSNLYLGLGFHEDALLFAEKAKTIDPLFKSAWMMEIIANFYLSRWEKTVDICQAFLAIDANNQSALTYLFRSYFLLHQKEKALATLTKLKNPEMLGLDLEIALLQENTDYVAQILADNNPNLAFTIYTYQGAKEQAKIAYQQATNDYLKTITSETTSVSSSYYLDYINDPRFADFRTLNWFQQIVALEKEKYDKLLKAYPKASTLILKSYQHK